MSIVSDQLFVFNAITKLIQQLIELQFDVFDQKYVKSTMKCICKILQCEY